MAQSRMWLSSLLSLSLAAVASGQSLEKSKHFEKEVRPVLIQHCIKCHGPKKQEGNLRLDSLAAMRKGGDSGPAVVPGKPGESMLVEAIRYEGLEMPPSKPLPRRSIDAMVRWIRDGATWPATAETLETGRTISEEDRQWWAFRPLVSPDIPTSPLDTWSQNPIDRFVWRKLAENKLQPAPRAKRTTLIRRLYFDLLGVPPTPEQVRSFVEDTRPDAWERVVDHLLQDPRYGEHWARFWLDLVRYSESDGWNQDAYRPNIWRYRDYVVRSFSEDRPYPRFVQEQLAGDEIESNDFEPLVAAGFLRLGIYEYNQRDARGHWNDIMNEMTDVVGDVFLGMGLACARCHDHKFDPILQVDYFKLRAFFEPIHWRDDLQAATSRQKQAHAQANQKWLEATKEVRAKIDALIKPYHDKKWKSTVEKFPLDIQACFNKSVDERNSWENQMAYLVSRQFIEEGGGPLKSMSKDDKAKHAKLLDELAKFKHLKPKPLPMLMTATDFAGAPAKTFVPETPDQSIPPGYLTVLSRKTKNELPVSSGNRTTGRRTALAKWISDSTNPLTTRVIVNRIWQQHFGAGIVPTASDFGHMGQKPTHPELLDWLTTDFVENGWSIQRLTRKILLSETWRQSATHPQANEQQRIDPQEQWLWRARIRRLQAEQIRDAMLSVSGELDLRLGGPSVDDKATRRAVYVKSFRNKTDTFLHAFDMANGLKSTSERNTTTTPTQSLLMFNGGYARARAKAMAGRLIAAHGADLQAIVVNAIQLTWSRDPSTKELAAATNFFGDSAKLEAELADFCHVLLNSNEFLYVD